MNKCQIAFTCFAFMLAFAGPSQAAEDLFCAGEVIHCQPGESITLRSPENNILTFGITERTYHGVYDTKTGKYAGVYVRNDKAIVISTSKTQGDDVSLLEELKGFPERVKKKIEDIRQKATAKLAKDGKTAPSDQEVLDRAWSIATHDYVNNPNLETEFVMDIFWTHIEIGGLR